MEPIHTEVELKKLVLNTWQIEGLPANPRKIDVNAFSKLKENITRNAHPPRTYRLRDRGR